MNTPHASMPVAVVGAGRMGRHHARTYVNLEGARLVGVVDPDVERAQGLVDEYGGLAYPTAEALLQAEPGLAAVTVASPTRFHAAASQPFIERQIACLIEKPLASTVDQARAICDLAQKHEAVLQVGHTERFNPAVRAAVELDFPTRFVEVERLSPMTFRSLDVGVVMDVMIHDLDIVLLFADSPIERVDATGVAVIGEHEDIANARIVFESGCVANLTASRLALKTQRNLRLFSEAGYVSLDYGRRTGWTLTRKDNAAALARVRDQLAQGQDLSQARYQDLLNIQPLDMHAGQSEQDPLTAQLTSFLHAARTHSPPTVPGQAGYAAVDAAQRVIEAIQGHTWDQLPSAPLG